MLKVAVCDDDSACRAEIGKAVGDILFSRDDYEIFYYRSGKEIKEAVEHGDFTAQLLLLDIHMHPVNGIEIAEWIRKHRVDVDIIFITVSPKYVYDCYTYRAFAYLLKPVSLKRLQQELNRYVDELEAGSEYINIAVRGCEHRIPLNEIRYFESDIRKIRVYLSKETLEFYGKLNELEDVLKGKGFLRCHQSYLVNKNYVNAIRRNVIELEGTEIPISRKYWEMLKKQL